MTTPTGTLRFSLTSAAPACLAAFYQDALGFEQSGHARVSAAPYGVDGTAELIRLRLGAQEIELVGFEPAGRPYPEDSTSHDGWFQHLALVANDIDAAYARLAMHPGWSPISHGDGPVRLPESSGGVRAFKFRDPEGHPLELLQFPPDRTPPFWSDRQHDAGPLIGIDHSAIVVADIERSIAFYSAFGFTLSASSENTGAAQDALDGADGVAVSVRALSRDGATPHLELLGYRQPVVTAGQAGPADVACSRTILEANGHPDRDPDGHMVLAPRPG